MPDVGGLENATAWNGNENLGKLTSSRENGLKKNMSLELEVYISNQPSFM